MRILFLVCSVTDHDEKFIRSLSAGGYETRIFSFHQRRVDERLASLPHISVDAVPLRVLPRLQRFLPAPSSPPAEGVHPGIPSRYHSCGEHLERVVPGCAFRIPSAAGDAVRIGCADRHRAEFLVPVCQHQGVQGGRPGDLRCRTCQTETHQRFPVPVRPHHGHPLGD